MFLPVPVWTEKVNHVFYLELLLHLLSLTSVGVLRKGTGGTGPITP